jgi:Protein of unknown function (DUF559)
MLPKVHLAEENQKLDKLRQDNIELLGITVFRFTNQQVRREIESVIAMINDFIKGKFIFKLIKTVNEMNVPPKSPLQRDGGLFLFP